MEPLLNNITDTALWVAIFRADMLPCLNLKGQYAFFPGQVYVYLKIVKPVI